MEHAAGPGVLIAAIDLTGGIVANYAQSAGSEMVSEYALKDEIATCLPAGTPAAQVEAWLAAKGLEQSGLTTMSSQPNIGANPGTLEIKAIVRHGTGAGLVRTDTQLVFVFDRARRLVEARVTPVHTGL